MKTNVIKEYFSKHPYLKKVIGPAIKLRRCILGTVSARQRVTLRNMMEMLVEDPIVELPEFKGQFAVSATSDLFFHIVSRGSYEPFLSEICKTHISPEKDVIDIGANVGFYTVLSAKCISSSNRVLAIEPTKHAYERLRRNLILNSVEEKVVLYNGAFSNRSGKTIIHTIEGMEEYSSLGGICHPSVKNSMAKIETVECSTLDEIVQKNRIIPGFIKMDVEGAEVLVLEGGKHTIRKYQPIILSEMVDYMLVKNGSSGRKMYELLKDYGYRIIDPHNGNSPSGIGNSNTVLCIPH